MPKAPCPRDVVVDIFSRFLSEDRLASVALSHEAEAGDSPSSKRKSGAKGKNKGQGLDAESDAEADMQIEADSASRKAKRNSGKSKGSPGSGRKRARDTESAGTSKRTKRQRANKDGKEPKLSALLAAANRDDCKQIELALADGGDIDELDGSSRTALMLAAAEGHKEAVKLLLDRSRRQQRGQGRTHRARARRHFRAR